MEAEYVCFNLFDDVYHDQVAKICICNYCLRLYIPVSEDELCVAIQPRARSSKCPVFHPLPSLAKQQVLRTFRGGMSYPNALALFTTFPPHACLGAQKR